LLFFKRKRKENRDDGEPGMWLVVGLGNPGQKYLLTRHNIGFMVIDHFLRSVGTPPIKSQKKAETALLKFEGESVLMVKPQTYMNLSGQSVQALMAYYKVPVDRILVIQDDVDQEFGAIKFQKDRGAGGHRGIDNISQLLGRKDYARLKIGVDRPPHPAMETADYVLQNFSPSEMEILPDIIERACDGIESFVLDGYQKTINEYNRKNWRDKGEGKTEKR
jgi:PTH1 family peptidyl-tRNA hydrolase